MALAAASAQRLGAGVEASTAHVDAVEALLDEAREIAELALASYEAPRSATPANETTPEGEDHGGGDVMVLTPPPPCPSGASLPWRVASVAFVARLELGEHARRVGATRRAAPRDEVLETCDAARGAVSRSLGALSQAIGETEGVRGELGSSSVDLDRSLRVRRALSRLRNDVAHDTRPTPAGTRVRLRCELAAISRLLEDVGALMRAADRRALDALRDRANICLHADPLTPRGGHAAAEQITADLEGLAERLLFEMNRREELLEHDRHELAGATLALANGDMVDLVRRLVHVEGRSPTVDALLREAVGVSADRWERALAHLHERLDLTTPASER